jgi:hypothetical protein
MLPRSIYQVIGPADTMASVCWLGLFFVLTHLAAGARVIILGKCGLGIQLV